MLTCEGFDDLIERLLFASRVIGSVGCKLCLGLIADLIFFVFIVASFLRRPAVVFVVRRRCQCRARWVMRCDRRRKAVLCSSCCFRLVGFLAMGIRFGRETNGAADAL